MESASNFNLINILLGMYSALAGACIESIALRRCEDKRLFKSTC
nr:MAG TPA: hypothetical protein [Caudoviricetes sp.]